MFLVSPREPFLSCWIIWPQTGEIWALVCRLLTFCKALRCGFVSDESTQLFCSCVSFLPWFVLSQLGVGVLDGVWSAGFGRAALLSPAPCPCPCTQQRGWTRDGNTGGNTWAEHKVRIVNKKEKWAVNLLRTEPCLKPLQLLFFVLLWCVLHKAFPFGGEVLSFWIKVQTVQLFESNSVF